jgi:hypothetical protein
LSADAVAARWIRRALLRRWNLADPGPWSLPTPTAPSVVSERLAHPLLGLHSPTGYGRSQPWHREPLHAWSSDRCHPSLGVLVPSADVSTRDPVTPVTSTSPAPCVLRVLRPLDALLPLEPSSGCPPGRSWDSSLQGLAPADRYGALSGMSRAFLTLPTRPSHASNDERSDPVLRRGDQASREIRVGRLQGLSCRQSVPLHRLFRVLQRPMPSWLSSSSRLSPPSLPTGRRRSLRSRASSPIVSLASHDRSCTTACCQTRAVALSLSRLPAFPRFLPWVGPPIERPRGAGSLCSPRGRWSVTGPSAPRFAPRWTPY